MTENKNTNKKKKGLLIGTAAVAAIALGGGLFAWSANVVNVGNVATVGVTTTAIADNFDGEITVDMTDVTFNGTAFTLNSFAVKGVLTPDTDLSQAGQQEGLDGTPNKVLKVTAYNSAGATVASGTETLAVNELVNGATVTLGTALELVEDTASLFKIDRVAVTIK